MSKGLFEKCWNVNVLTRARCGEEGRLGLRVWEGRAVEPGLA